MSLVSEKIKDSLPKIEKIKLRNEVDCYGISKLISSSLNLPFTPKSYANWTHGWIYHDLKYIEQFGEISDLKYLVLNNNQKLFFEKNGKNAISVGAPFIYAEDIDCADIQRVPNSLLVMPPHGLDFTNEIWDESSYVELINNLKDDFDCIVVCLNESCVNKNNWTEQFDKHSIPWIVGAAMDDKNALVRMSRIFKSFEYMTTNAIGSHVAYAAYSGCKVSIYGPLAEWKKEYVENDELYRMYPRVMNHNLSNSTEDFISKKFPFLFIHPKKAVMNDDWANFELGREHKKSYFELSVILGWLPHQQLYFLIIRIYMKIKKELKALF